MLVFEVSMYLTGEALAVTVLQNSSIWNASKGNSNNSTNESSNDLHQPLVNEEGELARVVIVGFILTIFILIAIIGNFLVITAIVTDRNLRKAGNNFVISLAVADALVACLVMTFAAVNDLTYKWSFGPVFCDIWQSLDVMCCTASILNICAVSLDRYIHIRDPLRYRNLVTQRRSLVAVALIWIMSALLSFLPIHLGWHRLGKITPNDTVTLTETNGVNAFTVASELDTYTRDFYDTQPSAAVGSGSDEGSTICYLDLSPWYAGVSSTVSFYIPCIVMIVIYARLYRLSQRHRQFMKSVSVTKELYSPVSSNLHISGAVGEPEEEEEETAAACDTPATPGANGPVRPGSESIDDQSVQQRSCFDCHSVPPVVTISTRSSLLEGLNQDNHSRHWSVGSSSVGVDSSTSKRRILMGELRRTMATSRSFSDLDRNGTTQTIREHGPSVTSSYPQRQSQLDGLNQENNSRHWSVGSSYLGVDSSTGKRRLFGTNLRRAIAASRSLSDFDRGGTAQTIPEQRPPSVVSSYPPRQSDYKTAITVGCIIGIFLFCWGPFFIINIIGSIWEGSISPVVFTCFSWIGYLNSCANPVIYGVTNVEFRRAFLRILMGSCFAWRHRRRRHEVPSPSQNPGTGRRRAVWSENNNYREVRTYDSPLSANGQR